MTQRWAFTGLKAPLVVAVDAGIDADEVAAACRLLLPGWPCEAAAAEAPTDIAIAPSTGGYRVSAQSWPGGEAFAADINNLANALGGLLVDALLARHASLCCLHAACVGFGGGAIVCIGRSQAGKSTLALRFAARGHHILGDDRLLVDTRGRDAIAVGLAAKARLPVPPGDGLEAFVAARATLTDRGLSYLHLRPAEQAPFGQRLPLAAFVLVERHADMARPVEFTRLGAGRMAASLIAEATAPGTAEAVVAAAARLARGVPGYRLAFADGSRAVDAILRELSQPTGIAVI